MPQLATHQLIPWQSDKKGKYTINGMVSTLFLNCRRLSIGRHLIALSMFGVRLDLLLDLCASAELAEPELDSKGIRKRDKKKGVGKDETDMFAGHL